MILEALVSYLVSYGCILIRWHIAILFANLNFMSFKTEGEVLSQKPQLRLLSLSSTPSSIAITAYRVSVWQTPVTARKKITGSCKKTG